MEKVRFGLRIKRSTWEKFTKQAAENNRSANAELIALIEKHIGKK